MEPELKTKIRHLVMRFNPPGVSVRTGSAMIGIVGREDAVVISEEHLILRGF